MQPLFYFACGARPSWRDIELAIACGQTTFLVPAGSPAAEMLRRQAGAQVMLDSGAWPQVNPSRLSLPAYARTVRGWCHEPSFAWACTYDTIGAPAQTARDHAWLLSQPWPLGEAPIVPVIHYPGGTAADILDELLLDAELLDESERRSTELGCLLGAVDGPVDWPAYAIGGLVPARYSTHSSVWYQRLIGALEAAKTLDPFTRRIHLLGISRPSWVLRSPLVMSFDSSMPARQASFGWEKIAPSYTDAFGLTPDKLKRSRDARLVYWIAWVRAAVGLAWQAVDEALLRDDSLTNRRWTIRHAWTQLGFDWIGAANDQVEMSNT